MSINLLDSFNYKGKRPDFVRQQFGTIAAMKAFSDNYLPDMYLAFCLEDGKVYIYNRNNAVDETTGRWRELEGGGDLSNYYTKSETNTLLAGKQDELQYDSVPTYGSTNVMTSGGIFNALVSKQNTLVFDNQPRASSSNPVASSGLYNEFQTVATRDARQQEELDFLACRTVKNLVVPTTLSKTMCGVTFTVGSDNKVTISGGVADPHTFACITLVGATQDQANTYENQVPIPRGTYNVVCLGGSESTYYIEVGFRNLSTGTRQTKTVYDGASSFTITTDTGRYDLVLYCKSKTSGYTATVAPMVCLTWFDNTYAPYAPTNKELYDMIALKQNALTFDSAPTDGSQNPVTSDGIYDALLTKVTAAQAIESVLGTSSATDLIQNENLNDKTNLGIYVGSDTVSSSILNNPVSSAGTPFRLYVIAVESSTTKMQILIPNTNAGMYARIYNDTNQSWSSWQQYARINDIAPIATKQVFGQGTRIQNANMDDYWQPGNYYIATADDLENITNKPDPVYSARARVVVLQFTGTSTSNYRSVQIWIPQILGTDNARYYMRYRTTNSQGVVSWTTWRTFSEATAIMGMGTNPYISEDTTGIDLNDYTIAGTYIKQYVTNVDTFLHTPFQASGDHYGYTAAAFKLIVEYINSSNNIRQTLIPLYESTGYFVRTRMTGAGGEWKPWVYYYGAKDYYEGLNITASQDSTFDLDDLKTLGRFNYGATVAPYINSLPSDAPTASYGGQIIVETNQLSTRFVQTLRINSTSYIGKYWQRYYTYEGWQPWFRFEGTQVT